MLTSTHATRALLVSALLLLNTSEASACSCSMKRFPQRVEDADVSFRGRVRNITHLKPECREPQEPPPIDMGQAPIVSCLLGQVTKDNGCAGTGSVEILALSGKREGRKVKTPIDANGGYSQCGLPPGEYRLSLTERRVFGEEPARIILDRGEQRSLPLHQQSPMRYLAALEVLDGYEQTSEGEELQIEYELDSQDSCSASPMTEGELLDVFARRGHGNRLHVGICETSRIKQLSDPPAGIAVPPSSLGCSMNVARGSVPWKVGASLLWLALLGLIRFRRPGS